MTGRGSFGRALTNAEFRHTLFLTLALSVFFLSRFCHADTIPVPDTQLVKQRLGEVENYIRKESLSGLSILPGEAREALSWFSGWHQLHFTSPSDEISQQQDVQNQFDNKNLTDSDASFPVATSFHHKGFLPTHDAMVVAVAINKNLLSNKLQFTARPFYGQSWDSVHGYWGGEVVLNMPERTDGLPWGKLNIGYIRGEESMTDHGSGLDLHGDIDLTNGFKFTSGVRQNSLSGNSDYALIGWGLKFN